MLGQMVTSYFKRNNYVVHVFDEHYTINNRKEYVEKIKLFGPSYIFNCIGLIPQKSTITSDLFFINSFFPSDLVSNLAEGQHFIHPSTDCVFDGLNNKFYSKYDVENADDDYGKSKAYGELLISGKKNTTIVRVSIIGLNFLLKKQFGLLGWFLEHDDKQEVNGYTNHYWNGITTLEWCKIVEREIINSRNERKIIQLGTKNEISKYDLLLLFNKSFKRSIIVKPFLHAKTVKKLLTSDLMCSEIETQLVEFKKFNS